MMSAKMVGRQSIPPWEMTSMESRLEAALHGVNPRPDFVSNLRTRLNQEPAPAYTRAEVVQYAVLSAAGVAGAVLLILAGIKAIVALMSIMGILHQVSRGRTDSRQAAA